MTREANAPFVERPAAGPNSGLSSADFKRLSEFIHQTAGITLAPSKRIMVETRLRNRLAEIRMPSFRAYCDYVLGSGGESEIAPLLDRITTNKTDFFREPGHFEFLVSTAIPEIQALYWSGSRAPLSVWSAGCSTGEEPYTIAIVLSEYGQTQRPQLFRFAIKATDLSTRVLDRARQGVYSTSDVAPIPDALRHRYLLRSKDRASQLVRVCPELRATVEFRRLNLLDEDLGFDEPFELIFCRNVMIYFTRETQQQVADRLVSCLRPGGYLFLGHSESLNGLDTPVTAVAPSIYRKPS